MRAMVLPVLAASLAHAQCGDPLFDQWMGCTWGFDVDGDLLYTGTSTSMYVWDVSDLDAPVQLASVPDVRVRDVKVRDGLAYVLGTDLQIYDVNDPTSPALLGNANVLRQYRSIALADDRLFAGTASGRLLVFDVSAPTAPALVNEIFGDGEVGDLEIDGHLLYAAGLDRFFIVDVSDPAHLVIVGEQPTQTASLELVDNVLYTVTGDDGNQALYAFDVSEPADITLLDVATSPSLHDNLDVKIAHDRAWVASSTRFRIYDVADPAALTFVCQIEIGNSTRVRMHETTAFLGASGNGAMRARDITKIAACPADANGDGALDALDFAAFQTLFLAGDPCADCNQDLELTILDFICFQQIFQEGCE